MDKKLINTILESPNLRQVIELLQHSWEEEQRRRHKFWTDVDEGQKVEFIQGKPFTILLFTEDIG